MNTGRRSSSFGVEATRKRQSQMIVSPKVARKNLKWRSRHANNCTADCPNSLKFILVAVCQTTKTAKERISFAKSALFFLASEKSGVLIKALWTLCTSFVVFVFCLVTLSTCGVIRFNLTPGEVHPVGEVVETPTKDCSYRFQSLLLHQLGLQHTLWQSLSAK